MTSRELSRGLDRPGYGTRARRETLPIYDEDHAGITPRLSHAEQRIVDMLEAGIDPLTVCRAIRAGTHLRWKAPDAGKAKEAA